MQEFKFEGCSDDTFGEYGVTNDDYDNCASGEPIRFQLITPDGAGIIVTGCYGEKLGNGCWMIGAELLDEDKPVDWKITMNIAHEGYRNQMIVLAPDEAHLTCLTRA